MRTWTAAVLLPVDGNVNHGYVADPAVAHMMRDRGWYDEGVRFCARPLESNE